MTPKIFKATTPLEWTLHTGMPYPEPCQSEIDELMGQETSLSILVKTGLTPTQYYYKCVIDWTQHIAFFVCDLESDIVEMVRDGEMLEVPTEEAVDKYIEDNWAMLLDNYLDSAIDCFEGPEVTQVIRDRIKWAVCQAYDNHDYSVRYWALCINMLLPLNPLWVANNRDCHIDFIMDNDRIVCRTTYYNGKECCGYCMGIICEAVEQ